MSLFRLNFQEKYLEMVIKYCLGKVFFILLDPRFCAFFSNSFYFRSLFSLKYPEYTSLLLSQDFIKPRKFIIYYFEIYFF